MWQQLVMVLTMIVGPRVAPVPLKQISGPLRTLCVRFGKLLCRWVMLSVGAFGADVVPCLGLMST